MTAATQALATLMTALREAGMKIGQAVRAFAPHEDRPGTWLQRVIYREIEHRARTRGPEYWDTLFPGMPPEARAQRRIRRMLTRATVAGLAASTGASTAELLPLLTDGLAAPVALPLGLVAVGAEMLYTTALQIDLAFDLAAIYGVPFAADDVGEISTLLAAALGVELVGEPTLHDKPPAQAETKLWRVLRQMQRDDFASEVGKALLGHSVLRNVVPVAGVLVSAAWNQVVLRRFARQVHVAVRQRLGIVSACRSVGLGGSRTARSILDGAWLIATADGELRHQEALALSTLIGSLSLPERIAVQEASFPDDEEEWFARLLVLDPTVHLMLMRVLVLVASADGELSTPERRFLRRVARTLGREIDLAAVDRFVAHVRGGELAQHLDWEPAFA